jgi:predicted dehydrogenase
MLSLTRRSLIAGASASGIALAAETQAPIVKLPKKARLAILGLSGHISEILDALKVLPDVKLQAISDSDPKRLHAVGERTGVPAGHRYPSHQELLKREQFEIAGICGSDGERAQLILDCAARGQHIIAEKPLAREWADLEKIRAALRTTKVKLTTLLPMRFEGSFTAMKQIVESGQIGEIAQIDTQKSYVLGNDRPDWMLHRSSFSGTIPYIGIHLVDLMRFTSRRELVRTAAFQAHIGQPAAGDMENSTVTIFQLDNGGTAQMHLDYLRPATASTHGDDRLRLAGTKGIVEYREADGLTLITNQRKLHTIEQLPRNRSLVVNFIANLYGSEPLGLTLDDIFRANEIVFTARDAAKSKRVLEIRHAGPSQG